MKIFISGAEGALGQEMTRLLRNEKIKFLAIDVKQLDITDFKATNRVLLEYHPDVILHFAAVSDVDTCEVEQDLALRVNALSSMGLAIIAKKIGAKMLYTSTNFVFDGNSEEAYSEYSEPNPISVYGNTKLLGERYVRDICERYYIVRTSWLFGRNSKTYISKFLAAEKKPGSIDVICDQFASLTYIEHLAEAILRVITSDNYGIYHIVNRGVASWLDFVLRAKKIMRFKTNVRAIKMEELNLPASRPRYSPLESNNYEFLFSCQMKSWEEALNDFIKILLQKP
ncbi:MAG: dTDP-4-dehydrorhamnose reductase [candidate division WOR-3 bacterium]|nr:dTDP-4-dehydrorhamnose reductase [candidate division WOR-3 bacterium]